MREKFHRSRHKISGVRERERENISLKYDENDDENTNGGFLGIRNTFSSSFGGCCVEQKQR